jgi:small subunit ribosomal protein S2
MLDRGLEAIRDVVAGGGRLLMVGTKRQAAERVQEAAQCCGQYYVNHRWQGGMLTNERTMCPVDQNASKSKRLGLMKALSI